MSTNPRKWQTENIVFFGDDTSLISLLFPIILRSEVHDVERISIRILQWPRNTVLLPSVMWIEDIVDCMSFIRSKFEVGTIVRTNDHWFPSTCIEMSQGSK